MHLRRTVPFRVGCLFALWQAAGLVDAAQEHLVPAGFLGHWASSGADCQRSGVRGDLVVTQEAFNFTQGFGRVRSVRQAGAGVVEFEMSMTGEARGRVQLHRFSLSADLHTLSHLTGTVPDGVPVRIRCAGVPLLPVDGAVANASFHEFRTELVSAIDRKDKAFILSIVSPHIMNSFGGDGGIEEFEEVSRLDDKQSWFWKEFGAVMRMGGSSSTPDSFAAPYTWTNWPEGLDGFGHLAVIGRNVNVRGGPSMDSPVIATVSYQTLPHVGTWQQESEWVYVGLDDGRAGYIHEAFVRSHIGYRALFSRRDGRWWLDTFIAGD
jgi:hypothetical protein